MPRRNDISKILRLSELRKTSTRFAAFAMLAMILSQDANACTSSGIAYAVGNTFNLKFADSSGVPISGFLVELESIKRKIQGITDGEGRVYFTNVRKGNYSVRVGGQELLSVTMWVEDTRPKETSVDLQWPKQELITSRTAFGHLRLTERRGSHWLPGVVVALKDVRGGKIVARASITENGDFAFGFIEPGLYSLAITKRDREISNAIPIRISESASSDALEIPVGDYSCEMMASENCPTEPVIMKDVRGTVIDSVEAVIVGAKIKLSGHGKEWLTTSKVDGSFSFPQVPYGNHILIVDSPGFPRFQSEIEIADVPSRPLRILLTTTGITTCSDEPADAVLFPRGADAPTQ